MLNFYDYIAHSKYYKTFKVDDLLFVEYKCLIREDTVAYWTDNNYFAYILSGVTKYINGETEHIVRQGDAMFVRKGTYVAHRHSSGDYCALVIFVPDEFISRVVDKYPAAAPLNGERAISGITPDKVRGAIVERDHRHSQSFPRALPAQSSPLWEDFIAGGDGELLHVPDEPGRVRPALRPKSFGVQVGIPRDIQDISRQMVDKRPSSACKSFARNHGRPGRRYRLPQRI